jgi:heme-degrading monooxygenase HmoA
MKTYFIKSALFTVGLMVLMSCNQTTQKTEKVQETNNKTEEKMEQKSVMEIAIRKVKEGQDEAFVNARTAFIGKLKSQNGIQKDWEFKSFFTMPEPDDTDVFVGMTRYESAEAMQEIANNLMKSPEAGQFFGTFDMKAFVAIQPADGGDFKLEDYIKAGNVLEVAVRTVKEGKEDEYDAKRKGFFDLIAQQDGYIFDREFTDLQTGDKVVLIGWKSMEDFQKGAGFLQTQPQMGEFFEILNVKAYQALVLSSN